MGMLKTIIAPSVILRIKWHHVHTTLYTASSVIISSQYDMDSRNDEWNNILTLDKERYRSPSNILIIKYAKIGH